MTPSEKITTWMARLPLLHPMSRRLVEGGSRSRWHLVIQFNSRNQSWGCQSFLRLQNRNHSSIHLITSAMEEVRRQLRKSFKVAVWLGDSPPEWSFCGPHLGYARSPEQNKTTLIPDFVFWSWPEAGILDYDQTARQMVESSRRPISKRGAFWIGAVHKHQTRKLLFALAQRDSRITARGVEWIGDDGDAPSRLLATKGDNYVSLPDHCDYQYLIDLQGGGYSGRLKLLLFSGRPVFLQHRRWQEYFFDRLKPFEHFIPVSEDLSNLPEMLDWADGHPAEAARIALAAQKFAVENLMRQHAIAELGRIFLQLGGGRTG